MYPSRTKTCDQLFRMGLIGLILAGLVSFAVATNHPTFSWFSSATALVPTKGQNHSPGLNQPQDYPTGLYQAYLTTLQNEGNADYQAHPATQGGLTAINPAQSLTTRFSTTGAEVEGLDFELSRIGYANQNSSALELAQEVEPVALGNRVTYQSAPDLTQWYLNGPLGLEQGFTLARPLAADNNQNQVLEVELKLGGLKEAHLNDKNDNLTMTLADGRELNYGQLYVYDTAGKNFPAHFGLTALDAGKYHLTIKIEEVIGASYPLTVDPLLFQSQTLTDSSTGGANDRFGTSIAMSSDGNTALIGAFFKTINGNNQQGAAYIYTRSGPGAAYSQTQFLSDTTGAASDRFGTTVALSSDGNTAVIGTGFKASGQGAVYVFKRNGVGTPYTQSQFLNGSVAGASSNFGSLVALSADGNTALVSAVKQTVGTNTEQGAVYVFKRTGAGAAYTQSQILSDTATGAAYDNFGSALALSSDGNTALIGAYLKPVGTKSAQGVAYIFSRSGPPANYTQSQILSDTATGATNDYFGKSAALSADGNTALIGDAFKKIGSNSNQGAAYIFKRTGFGATYALSQRLTNDTSGTPYDYFGNAVALSADGNTAVIGSDGKKNGTNSYQGAVYLFSRAGTGASYSQSQTLNSPNTDATDRFFGSSVAVSSDSNTVLSGAIGETVGTNASQGEVTAFTPCDPLQVTSNVDDGSCGTLRQAVLAASTGSNKTIMIMLPAGSVISLTSGITLSNGIVITTTAGSAPSGGPGIIIQGNGPTSGDGLTLVGTDTLNNLWVRGFSGRQIVAPAGSHGVLKGVRASKS